MMSALYQRRLSPLSFAAAERWKNWKTFFLLARDALTLYCKLRLTSMTRHAHTCSLFFHGRSSVLLFLPSFGTVAAAPSLNLEQSENYEEAALPRDMCTHIDVQIPSLEIRLYGSCVLNFFCCCTFSTFGEFWKCTWRGTMLTKDSAYFRVLLQSWQYYTKVNYWQLQCEWHYTISNVNVISQLPFFSYTFPVIPNGIHQTPEKTISLRWTSIGSIFSRITVLSSFSGLICSFQFIVSWQTHHLLLMLGIWLSDLYKLNIHDLKINHFMPKIGKYKSSFMPRCSKQSRCRGCPARPARGDQLGGRARLGLWKSKVRRNSAGLKSTLPRLGAIPSPRLQTQLTLLCLCLNCWYHRGAERLYRFFFLFFSEISPNANFPLGRWGKPGRKVRKREGGVTGQGGEAFEANQE